MLTRFLEWFDENPGAIVIVMCAALILVNVIEAW